MAKAKTTDPKRMAPTRESSDALRLELAQSTARYRAHNDELKKRLDAAGVPEVKPIILAGSR